MTNYDRNRITLMRLSPKLSKDIFDENRTTLLIRQPLFKANIDSKIYVVAADEKKEDVTGFFRVLNADYRNKGQLDGNNKGSRNQCTIKLYDVTEFERPLSLSTIRTLYANFKMEQQFRRIGDPIKTIIEDWDIAFALDGTELPKDGKKEEQRILTKARQAKQRDY